MVTDAQNWGLSNLIYDNSTLSLNHIFNNPEDNSKGSVANLSKSKDSPDS